MPLTNKLIIHIGLPKTATTSIQNLLFLELHKNGVINYFGRLKTEKGQMERSIMLLTSRLLDYFSNAKRTPPKVELKNDIINLYSDELLTCPPSHTYTEGVDVEHNENRDIIISQGMYGFFHEKCPEIKIILTLRSQKTMVPSFFVQTFHVLGKFSPKKFIDFIVEDEEKFNTWYYDELLKIYSDTFGEENIRVLLYEDLLNDSEKYYEEWAKILDVKREIVCNMLVKEKLNRKEEEDGKKVFVSQKLTIIGKIWLYFRRISGITRIIEQNRERWDNNKIRLFFERIFLMRKRSFIVPNFTEKEQNMIFDHYKTSNLKLIGKYGLDEERLKKYGYI